MADVIGISWKDPVRAILRTWEAFLDWESPQARRSGIPYSRGVCSCGLAEFSNTTPFSKEEMERKLFDAGMRSQSPEETCLRVEAIQQCLRLLGRLSEDDARALLAYYAGDRGSFIRLTHICDKDCAAMYVAERIRLLAMAAREHS